MNTTRLLLLGALAVLLAGCAGSVSRPVALQPLGLEDGAQLRISEITADAEPGIAMSEGDFGLVSQKVRAYIETQFPGVYVDQPASPGALKMKIHFTRFDRGNAFARAMLAGLGQIKINATVSLWDNNQKQVAQYDVSKDFAFGGVVGATTTVEDVEEGFAKSVAEIVRPRTNQAHFTN
jgi:hypothetical protein